ncbi:hypothetical protein Bca52824_087989 [Brassica carinata]|uniref:Uncharacterized protein n=1 Tax=Brassica carinata TaxID=52824 RepID=A0A8X7TQD8_BRACI|nr:hypothetical protein Bca52824_087989 [Brassica carinata]
MCSSYRQVSDRNIRNGVELCASACLRVGTFNELNPSSYDIQAYLSNICVAKELHRNGVGYKLNDKSKLVAREWVGSSKRALSQRGKLDTSTSHNGSSSPSYYLLIHVQINGLRRHQDAKVVGTGSEVEQFES